MDAGGVGGGPQLSKVVKALPSLVLDWTRFMPFVCPLDFYRFNKFFIYIANSQKRLLQGTLYCEVKMLIIMEKIPTIRQPLCESHW